MQYLMLFLFPQVHRKVHWRPINGDRRCVPGLVWTGIIGITGRNCAMAFTYFFRDFQTLDLIREHVLPVIGLRRYINMWSAGCAMGQEPYTIAIILRENMGLMVFRNVKLLATDVGECNQFGSIIRGKSYPAKELERISPRDL